ncbi:hypothetical protein [Streptomyces sp. NPDC002276]
MGHTYLRGCTIYSPLVDMDFDLARGVLDEHLLESLRTAKECATRVRPGGSLTYITGSAADELERRREELRATLPIRPVVGPSDVAVLALRLMANAALTGATYDIDGGRQLIP